MQGLHCNARRSKYFCRVGLPRAILFIRAICVLQELTHKISEMKEKAEQSEAMVQEICRDIRKLDFAKKHITTTITALHRLAMLGLFHAFSVDIFLTLSIVY